MTLGSEHSGHGLVLVRGNAHASARWIRRGLIAVRVVDLPGWTGVALAQHTAPTQPPYDVGLEILASRRVAAKHRPAIGFFVIDGAAVITAQLRGWRAEQRWLVWEPGIGVRRTPSLLPLPAAVVVDVAGARRRTSAREVAAHLSEPDGTPIDVLAELMQLLGLPGVDVLRHGAGSGHPLVESHRRSVLAFDALAAEEAEHRAEAEHHR